MKKQIALSLALLAGLVMGATSANAAEIKATGNWQVDAGFVNKNYFQGDGTGANKTVSIDQRVRTTFQFIANENLRGVFETQVGISSWGNGDFRVGDRGATDNADDISLRKAYLDFNWPGTKYRFLVGKQSLSLPAAFGGGSAILDDHMSAAAAIIPVTDNIALVGGYARLADANNNHVVPNAADTSGTADAAFLYSNLKFGGFEFNPFFMYAYSGDNSGATGVLDGLSVPGGLAAQTSAKAYWAGTAFTMTALDPFKVVADINYGKADYSSGDAERSGWLFDVAVDYTGLSMMTPSLFFAYSSGENSNNSKSDRMPVVGAQNWAIGSFWMQGGDTLTDNYTDPSTNLGFWAAGVSLKDIKLIDKLTHTFNVIYFKGTNDKNSAVVTANTYGTLLTEKDSLVEVDLNSQYQLYEELSLGLELGYIFADFDKNVWARAGSAGELNENAYKATFMLKYSF